MTRGELKLQIICISGVQNSDGWGYNSLQSVDQVGQQKTWLLIYCLLQGNARFSSI